MTVLRIFIVAASVTLLCSCYKTRCFSTQFAIRYSGFDSAELSVAVIKKYAPTHDFSNMVDVDTVSLVSDSDVDTISAPMVFSEHFDWEIVLPKVNRTDRISDLVMHESSNSGSSGRASNYCYNGWYYTLNGKRRSSPSYGTGYGNNPGDPLITR
jgi:hypothetical protein